MYSMCTVYMVLYVRCFQQNASVSFYWLQYFECCEMESRKEKTGRSTGDFLEKKRAFTLAVD